eukprot:TRINITY_DN98390_c0_g1_i1.p1 TRINITY_DN98390_c0_g1~~TRINITY_DN98390_c0_g1_i1.p1  ORF type:complete len:278 (+),score=47.47 TRINITY_DN98390_c0_g1_i1:37-834(+)
MANASAEVKRGQATDAEADEDILAEGLFQEPQHYFRQDDEEGTVTEHRCQSGKLISLQLVKRHALWGHVLWNSSRYLCNYFERTLCCKGKSVVELGAGSGLVSIVAALTGAARVVVTDYPDAEVLDNASTNLRTNLNSEQLACSRVVCHLWGSDPTNVLAATADLGKGFDIIITADLVFNYACHRQLLESCRAILAPAGLVHVVFGHHRPWKAQDDLNFLSLATSDYGFEVQKVAELNVGPMFPEDPGDLAMRSVVHHFTLAFAK